MPEIFDRLSNDPALRYASRDEMLEHARRVVAAAEAEAPKWFADRPRRCRAPSSRSPRPRKPGMAAAYYMPGAIDGSRQGTYYLNTSKPEERHRYAAEDIAFHEAVPGHHFQLTIAMESKDLAPARQVLYDTACAEGWGLYSERLADEMGLYSDDLARMGLFAADSWRASRLVVDTGLHAMGWTRQQAVDWMAAHTPLPRIEIETEVDRYISYPGQALAYMVGRREIVRLRTEAAERLGARFDLQRVPRPRAAGRDPPAAGAGAHRRALGGGRNRSRVMCWVRTAWSMVSTPARSSLAGFEVGGLRARVLPGRRRCSQDRASSLVLVATRAARTTPNRATAVTWTAVHHRQMAPTR